MMTAIRTRYLSPTSTKPACIKASDSCGNSVVLPRSFDIADNHRAARSASL